MLKLKHMETAYLQNNTGDIGCRLITDSYYVYQKEIKDREKKNFFK